MLLLLALACSSCNDGARDVGPVPAGVQSPPPEIAMGVSEVPTPAGIVRASDVQDIETREHLDVWFEPGVTTFEGLGKLLDAWGFARLDGDGVSWRVSPPPGRAWKARLERTPEVAQVREALDREPLETGAFREGRESYGPLVHSWAWKEGGAVEQVAGGVAPTRPVLPVALPDWTAACLAPVQDELARGLSRGEGWERAYRAESPAWVLVVENYGACALTGWLPLVPDGDAGSLTVQGHALAAVQPGELHAAAAAHLRTERPADDPVAERAVAVLVDAPPETVARAIEVAANGHWQTQLVRQWADRDADSALSWARSSSLPVARRLLVALDPTDRETALRDAAAPGEVVLAALNAWRPGAGEGTDILVRLHASPDPRIRERAWERTVEQESTACLARVPSLASASTIEATGAWRSCPVPDVRVAAFARVHALDPEEAGKLVAEALEAPETVELGITAVRLAADAGRLDLLAALVPRVTVGRDVRRAALLRLIEARAPAAQALDEAHGLYLGHRPPLTDAQPATADGATP